MGSGDAGDPSIHPGAGDLKITPAEENGGSTAKLATQARGLCSKGVPRQAYGRGDIKRLNKSPHNAEEAQGCLSTGTFMRGKRKGENNTNNRGA